VIESSRDRLLRSLSSSAVVLDVGGWADPFERADWVLDVMPYASRGLYRREGWTERPSTPERFTSESWIQRDICEREPYPFADGEIDFAICSQTLEDVRDPLWVCSEINRIAKAGYVEVPSRLEEQSWGVNGPFVGWSHHRWLIDVLEQEIEFTVKLHSIHSRRSQHFPPGFWETLTPGERVQTLWWEGGFAFRERLIFDAEDSERYLAGFVAHELARRPGSRFSPPPDWRQALRRRVGRITGRG